MGKKARKARASSSSNQTAMIPKKVNELPGRDVEVAEEVVESVAEKKSCVHFDKGVKLDILLEKIKSSEQIKCGECKEGVHVKKGIKGKKGFSASDAKSAKKAIWVCLECGQFVCGGVGLPTGAQSHVVRHIRSTRHRLVIQWENPQLRWCFPCHLLLPVEKEDNGEKKDMLFELVKLIKERSSSTSASADTEDLCSASGSITSETKLEGAVTSSKEARDGYAVRGLVNLGNTCFFNSVLQNLLSLDQLREQFLKEDMSGGGPMVSSLKKIFAETKSEAGLKSVINPRAFFGSVCSKSPQFRGYQQHDSHELLRCLLDGLSTEESSLRKKLGVSETDGTSTHQKPTLVDSLFGGEISSTVSCLECGHSSKVYEPFLDLSLPVPSKKHLPVKLPTVSRPKKAKLPPKKVPKYRPALDRTSTGKALVATCDSSASCSIAPTSGHTDSGPSSALTICENQASEIATQTDTEFDSFWLDIIGPETSNSDTDLGLQGNGGDNPPTTQAVGVVQSPEIPASTSVSLDDQTSVGGTETLMHDNDRSVKPEPDLAEQDAGAIQSTEVAAASGISAEIDEAQGCSYHELGQSSSSANPWDDEELPLMVGDSQVLYMPYKDDVSCDDKTVAEVNGEASSSFVTGHHEQTVDYVDFSSFFEEPDVSRNDKAVGDGKGEASSSFVSGNHEDSTDDLNFGSLFDEPEISEGPVFGPPSKAEVSEASFMAISSDSDPEELDDSDSPVSVDRCLAQFTKPEILSDDNAWHCENCSRNLKLQRLKEKRKLKESSELIINGLVNENGASSASNECRDSPSSETCTNNENGYEEAVPITELTNSKEEKTVIDDEISGDHHTATEPPIANGETISSKPANGIEAKETEDEDVDSEKVIVKRDATKRVLLNKAPPVLTVHLKRFSQDARGRLSKLSGHVAFQEFIDLRQYMDSRWAGEEQPVYRLAGLVEHSGTMRGGHYISYIRGGHKVKRSSDDNNNNSAVWYHASDSYVRRATFEEVLRSEAYILFYERI